MRGLAAHLRVGHLCAERVVVLNARHLPNPVQLHQATSGTGRDRANWGRAGGNPCSAERFGNQGWRRVQRCADRPCGGACRRRKSNRCGAIGNRSGPCDTSSLGDVGSRYDQSTEVDRDRGRRPAKRACPRGDGAAAWVRSVTGLVAVARSDHPQRPETEAHARRTRVAPGSDQHRRPNRPRGGRSGPSWSPSHRRDRRLYPLRAISGRLPA
jgi:hypothetical protein